jgi:hypothetical protein
MAKSAWRVRVDSASDTVVIARCHRSRADRSSTQADAYTHADAATGIPTITAAAIDAADAGTAAVSTGASAVESADVTGAVETAAAAASRHRIRRNTSDAEHCSRRN